MFKSWLSEKVSYQNVSSHVQDSASATPLGQLCSKELSAKNRPSPCKIQKSSGPAARIKTPNLNNLQVRPGSSFLNDS